LEVFELEQEGDELSLGVLVPSPTRPERACCARCLRSWLLSRAQNGLLTDFAAPVEISVGQWMHLLHAHHMPSEWVLGVVQTYVRAQTQMQTERVERGVAMVNVVRDRSPQIGPLMAGLRATHALLEQQIVMVTNQIGVLQNLESRLHAFPRDVANDAPASVRGILDAASTVGILQSEERTNHTNALTLPCARCSGSWIMNGADAVCGQCRAAHCAQCGSAYDGNALEDQLPDSWKLFGSCSEVEYARCCNDNSSKLYYEAPTPRPHGCQADDMKRTHKLYLTTRNCPRCNVLVTRTIACPHMRCSMCDCRFDITYGVEEHADVLHVDEAAAEREMQLRNLYYLHHVLPIPHCNTASMLSISLGLRMRVLVATPMSPLSFKLDADAGVLSPPSDDGFAQHAARLMENDRVAYASQEAFTAVARIESRLSMITTAKRSATLQDWRFLVRQLRTLGQNVPLLNCVYAPTKTSFEQKLARMLFCIEFSWRRNGVEI